MNKKRLISLTLISCILVTGAGLTTNGSFESVAKASTVSAATESSAYNTKLSGSFTKDTMGTTSIDIPATGEITVTNYSSNEPATEELERLITTVKSKINVPNELSKFNYYYNADSYDSQHTWYLNWYNKEETKRISVQVDSKGNVLSYDSYDSNNGIYTPKYLKNELKSTADNFLAKVVPKIYNNVKYIGGTYQGVYSGQYIYQYERVENGIPMPDNTISVGISFETGTVESFYGNWLYDIKVPSSDVKISEKEAANKIGKTVTMKLGYQNKYTTDKDGKTTIKAFLVYAPDQSYVSVDAKTGEVYTTQDQWVYNTSNGTVTKESASTADKGGLTEEEIIKVEELSGLISRESAIKAVTDNKSLLLDKNLKSISAKLYKRTNYYYNSGDEEIYVWDINLTDPRAINEKTGDTYRANAYASVDAKTGKILSFNASVKDYYNMQKKEWESVKVKYSLKQGQTILESFLKTQIPDLFKNTLLTDNKESYIIGYKNQKEVYGGYYYNYQRVNEGINYSYNGIYGSVDGVTGKIYSFSYNWDKNVTFESPKFIITPEEAFDSYISNDGYRLVYEINNVHNYNTSDNAKDIKIDSSNGYTKSSEIRLVYRTDIYPGFISPFTGKLIDNEGKEYKDDKTSYTYSDISGTISERNIKLLADLGVGFAGGQFFPDKAITKEELNEFLTVIGYYYDLSKYKLEASGLPIDRLDAAKFMIQILDYDNIAKIKGIYSIDCNDKAQISDENIGYAALAYGFDLIDKNSNNELRPYANLTRAEAADMLIALLSVK